MNRKKMMGIFFIIIGVGLVFTGFVFIKGGTDKSLPGVIEMDRIIDVAIADGVLTMNEKNKIKELAAHHNMDHDSIMQKTEAKLQALNIDSETQLIDYNYKQGVDFEKYIVQRFDKRFFKIKNWAGDKFVEGYYAETTVEPDILYEFSFKGKTTQFYVECKWRSNYFKNGIDFAQDNQFKRYKEISRKKNIPVFIAIGVGGKASLPENVFMVPLDRLEGPFINMGELNKYQKRNGGNFYFNDKSIELR
jgi:hypothetical protein